MKSLVRLLAPIALTLLLAVTAGCGDDGDGGEPTPDAVDATDAAGDAGDADAGPTPEPVFEDLAVDEALSVPGLDGPVSVVRDDMGVPHVYATTLHDVFFAQGYVHAVDRMPAMELFRRVANGQLSGLLGALESSTIAADAKVLTLGFRRVARQQYDALEEGSRARRAMDAYAEGVTAFIGELRSGQRSLVSPFRMFLPVEAMADWTPIDSLAIGRVQARDLSFDGDTEIDYTAQVQAIREAFPADAAEPGVALRSGLVNDLQRWAPIDPTVQYESYALLTGAMARWAGDPAKAGAARRPHVPKNLLERARRFSQQASALLGDGQRRGASNSWAARPELTSTGHAILCNDPHLALDNPPLFHLSHLVVEGAGEDDVDVIGANFPGVPGFLIGHNQRVAWGLTTAADDRTDVYLEDFVAASGDEPPTTVVDGEPQPVTVLTETVEVGQLGEITDTIEIEVLVTAQGRILVPDLGPEGVAPFETGPQLSYMWTGFDATPEIRSVVGALYADSAQELMETLFDFHAANQNVVGADVDGNVFGLSPGRVPLREDGAFTWDPVTNQDGVAPWWVMPGDGSADWTGFLGDDEGPRAENPAKGFVVTANNDHFGQTLDDNPLDEDVYVGHDYSLGFRAGRITRLLDGTAPGSPAAGGAKLGLDEMRRIQRDTLSPLGEQVRPLLMPTLARMLEELETPGTHPELSALATTHAGDAEAFQAAVALVEEWDAETPAGVEERGATPTAEEIRSSAATTMFNLWVVELMDAALGDELEAIGEGFGSTHEMRALHLILANPPGQVETLDPGTGESIVWDDLDTPDHQETRDEVIAGAFFEAMATGAELYPEAPLEERAWGELHRLLLDSLLPIPGGALDLPPSSDPLHDEGGYARPGDNWTVNVCNGGLSDTDFGCGHGAVIRLCVDMDPAGPVASMMLPGGQDMDPNSEHYADWMPLWLDHEPTFWPFEAPEVRDQAESHTVLAP